MKCAIIAVGTELLFGNVVNTNAAFISQELNELGIDVLYHYTMGDNPGRLKRTLQFAAEDCDLLICTGGLGPTEDDLTRETVCECLDVPLVYNAEAEAGIHRHFKRLSLEYSKNNEKQTFVPEGAEIFQNSQGTAPGFAIEKNGLTVICLPGVPREMKVMFSESVRPYLLKYMNAFIVSSRIQLFGMGESLVETKLLDLIEGQTDPTIATYAKEGVVEVRVTSKRTSEEEAAAAVKDMEKAVLERVGSNVFSTGAELLQDVVGNKLLERGITVSCAESPTAGLFAASLVDHPGISEIFDRCYVLYSEESICEELNVDPDLVEKHSPYSREVCEAMARGVYEKTGSRLCAAIAGLAGPEGYGDIPPGTYFLSVLFDGVMTTKEIYHFAWTRRLNREFMAMSMLDMIDHIIDGRELSVLS
ncbi:MAG: competence/damage-inducible protein A [Firmicutes bacterium]|nr:competence/damage-inducible protein A [Bacillota bacterium]